MASEVKPQSAPIVIYVHGLYGCYLSKKGGSSIFSTGFELPSSLLKSFFFFQNGHGGIALPITWKYETNDDGVEVPVQDYDDIKPCDDFQISHGEFIAFLDKLHDLNYIQFHKIRWDWRRSFVDAEKYVSSELERILSSSEKKANIITHSTGCIITWPTINKHPEWFKSWINVAGAASGSNVILHELEHDWKYEDAKFLKVLSKEVMFTCPSQYGFLRATPFETFRNDNGTSTEFVKKVVATTTNGGDEKENPIYVSDEDIDLYDVKTWENFKLGIYGWKDHTVTEQEKEHLKNCLISAKAYRMKHFVRDGKSDDDTSFLSNKKEDYDHLDIICYGLDSNDTHSAYEVDLESKSVENTKTKMYTTGDGTVPSFGWKRIFGGLKRTIIYANPNSSHISMMNDLKLRKILMHFFFEDEEYRAVVQNILDDDEKDNGGKKGSQKSKISTVTAGVVALIATIMCLTFKLI